MFLNLLLASAAIAGPVPSDAGAGLSKTVSATLLPADMFELADVALARNDLPTAENVYRALASNPQREVRNEARFRLAMALIGKRQFSEGAVLFRQILDEQPDANRVRLELAAALAAIGGIL